MHQRYYYTAIAFIAIIPLIIACLIACGGRGAGPELVPAKSGFALHFWPESLIDEASVASVVAVPRKADGMMEVELIASDANGLKAVYVDLGYDADLYTPVSVTLSSEFADEGEAIELFEAGEPGKLYYGAILVHYPEHDGVSGNLTLATIKLALAPHRGVKQASVAPSSPGSAAMLSWNEATTTFTWGYSSQGDYDQNGETNISDLTPLGRHLLKKGPFEDNTVEAVVDGDSNGEINIADITQIGVNYKRIVDSYVLCASLLESDALLYLSDQAGVAAFVQATVPLADATGSPA